MSGIATGNSKKFHLWDTNKDLPLIIKGAKKLCSKLQYKINVKRYSRQAKYIEKQIM